MHCCRKRMDYTYVDSTSNHINSLRRSIMSDGRRLSRTDKYVLPTDVSSSIGFITVYRPTVVAYRLDGRFVQRDFVFKAHSTKTGQFGCFLRRNGSTTRSYCRLQRKKCTCTYIGNTISQLITKSTRTQYIVAEMGDRLATIDMGAAVPLSVGGSWVPI